MNLRQARKSSHEKCLGVAYHVYNEEKHPRADELYDPASHRELWLDLWSYEIILRISKPLNIKKEVLNYVRRR